MVPALQDDQRGRGEGGGSWGGGGGGGRGGCESTPNNHAAWTLSQSKYSMQIISVYKQTGADQMHLINGPVTSREGWGWGQWGDKVQVLGWLLQWPMAIHCMPAVVEWSWVWIKAATKFAKTSVFRGCLLIITTGPIVIMRIHYL